MLVHRSGIAKLALLCELVGMPLASYGQEASGGSAGASSEEAARQEILDSSEWGSMRDDFQKWLSIQQIYSQDEIAQLVNELNDRALQLSPDELHGLLSDMQGRLEVLLSPEAAEARSWAARLLATGREQQVRDQRPDVMSMSADEIRQELHRFEQRQIARQESQAAFEQLRGFQAQTAMNAHAARRQAQQHAIDGRSQAARNAQTRSPYAPRRQDLPNYTDLDAAADSLRLGPVHTVSPWGTPVRWHPFYGYWW